MSVQSNISRAINITKLKFAYGKNQIPVLDIKNFSLDQGKSMFLYGPSGSGKSTLLNLLSATLSLNIAPQNTGELTVLKQALHLMSNLEKDNFRANNLGVVYQKLNLISYLSVRDNLRLATSFSQTKFDLGRVQHILSMLNLPTQILLKKVSELSVGQQQRVAIARAIVHQPKLLIVDEPTSALDENATERFMTLLFNSISSLNASLLFVSHDMRLASYFDKSIALSDINSAMHSIDALGAFD